MSSFVVIGFSGWAASSDVSTPPPRCRLSSGASIQTFGTGYCHHRVMSAAIGLHLELSHP